MICTKEEFDFAISVTIGLITVSTLIGGIVYMLLCFRLDSRYRKSDSCDKIHNIVTKEQSDLKDLIKQVQANTEQILFFLAGKAVK